MDFEFTYYNLNSAILSRLGSICRGLACFSISSRLGSIYRGLAFYPISYHGICSPRGQSRTANAQAPKPELQKLKLNKQANQSKACPSCDATGMARLGVTLAQLRVTTRKARGTYYDPSH